jgi:hypothetical protein
MHVSVIHPTLKRFVAGATVFSGVAALWVWYKLSYLPSKQWKTFQGL